MKTDLIYASNAANYLEIALIRTSGQSKVHTGLCVKDHFSLVRYE